jgi:nicotinic acid mononucleotide adenylyltransferase
MSSLPLDRLRPGGARAAVLVTSGAYNPVHHNHLLYLEAARACVQQPAQPGLVCGGPGPALPLDVVGGYLSALPDRMVARGRARVFSRAQRSAMLQLACADSPWLMVVEAELHGLALFEAVARTAERALGHPISVIAVCGADGFAASDRFLPPHIPIACVRRSGADDEWQRLCELTTTTRRVYLVADNLQPQPCSATAIRGWLERAHDPAVLEQLRAHLHPDVLDYLLRL